MFVLEATPSSRTVQHAPPPAVRPSAPLPPHRRPDPAAAGACHRVRGRCGEAAERAQAELTASSAHHSPLPRNLHSPRRVGLQPGVSTIRGAQHRDRAGVVADCATPGTHPPISAGPPPLCMLSAGEDAQEDIPGERGEGTAAAASRCRGRRCGGSRRERLARPRGEGDEPRGVKGDEPPRTPDGDDPPWGDGRLIACPPPGPRFHVPPRVLPSAGGRAGGRRRSGAPRRFPPLEGALPVRTPRTFIELASRRSERG